MTWLRRFWSFIAGRRNAAAALRLVKHTRRHLRNLERLVSEQQADHDAKCRELDRKNGEIAALKAEVDGITAAHEKLVQANQRELAINRLQRIRFEGGAGNADEEE